ncbi:YheC/YheD family protein [Paenibacillus qinlingensis]|uniref:Glutathione synthase/RimK-type ligase-like ATP-grasp enzyme n=1 Tax=Paenibacillus qinlingensis TaxID=1837343 RepID=A0ABU1NZM1_9BACL|nr:YheC/YheD family protein [Paenibacillus qinlingensis]MDR6552945.1 glutathione synthase/RimK-type ligase-like ATP-grasp enzyme [Paenibacillus qinlingensis]
MRTQRPLLGIMVTELNRDLPFASSSFYQNLTIQGANKGIDVFVFSPNRIDWLQATVRGYMYDRTQLAWITKLFPLPSLIYDRCFFGTKQSYLTYQYHVRKLRELPTIRFLGYGLGGKWEVGQILHQDAALRPFLPETSQLRSGQQLETWLQSQQDVFLKPQGGSQGKGAIHIHKDGHLFQVKGRDGRNQPVAAEFQKWTTCWQWLKRLLGSRPYLLQQYLHLHSMNGMSYDVRSLVQKNGRGNWEHTGVAVRVGQPGSITSNLHGGGTAEDASDYLTREFGQSKSTQLMDTIDMLSKHIPSVLESYHGRLAELGIDFGIDTSGSVWILEVNSKPGRTIFARLHNERARTKSITNPIHYAGFLLNKQLS